MDLLYTRYANPMELVALYIDRGRFGTFVEQLVQADYQSKCEAAEKENDWKLWMMFINSASGETFSQWKQRVCPSAKEPSRGHDEDLTDADKERIVKKLFPN